MKQSKVRIFSLNILVVILCLATVFGLLFGTTVGASISALAEEAEAQTWEEEGWNEYGEGSVSETNGGIAMKNADPAGYSFSNTSKKAYTVRELSVSMRVQSYVYEAGVNAASIFVGLTSGGADLMATNGAYGVAFIPVGANEYNAWFVRRNSEATAIPGFDNLALVDGSSVKLSSSGVLSVLFHRESENFWLIMINGKYQINLNNIAEGERVAIYAALEGMSTANVAIAAQDNFSGAANQTMSLEVTSIGSEMLGTLNENGAITNSITTSSYEITENGVVFSTNDQASNPMDIKMGVQEKLAGKLDGFTYSVRADIAGCTGYSLDIGIGTYHEAGRYTFWDSFSGPPAVAGSFGIRISASRTATFLMLPRTASAGYDQAGGAQTADGNMGIGGNTTNEYTIQLLKIDADWVVLINGRMMGSAAANFQTNLNNALNSLDVATEEMVSPWISYGDVAGKNSYSASITVLGYGTQRWGREIDPNEGVMGDEIEGELEFGKKEWSSTCPEATAVDVKVTDEGFVLQGRNEETGFDIGMNYKKQIEDMDGFAATFLLPEKVLQSSGETHGRYGMYIGESTLKNFSDMKSIFIRWEYSTEDAADGATVEVIVWDNTNPALVEASSSQAVAGKTEQGKEREMTIRFVLDDKTQQYRIYANGTRITTPVVEEALTAQLAEMQAKYFYCSGSYEDNNGKAAWVESVEGMQEMTLVSLGGLKIVNKQAEQVSGITLDAVSEDSSSVKLTWTKAEYPVGDMDSYNFVPTGYEIDRIKGDAQDPEATIKVEGDLDTLTFTDTELDAETYYYYTVYAVDEDGNRLIVSNTNKRVKTLAEEQPGGN